MTPEEKLILFSALQDIADELRKLRRKRQKAENEESRERSEQLPDNSSSVKAYYTDQED